MFISQSSRVDVPCFLAQGDPAPSTLTAPATQFWSVIDGERRLPSEADTDKGLRLDIQGLPRPVSRGDESNQGAWGSPVGLMPMSPIHAGSRGDKVRWPTEKLESPSMHYGPDKWGYHPFEAQRSLSLTCSAVRHL